MEGYTQLETERLVLRTLTEADAAAAMETESLFANEMASESDALNWIRWLHGRTDTVCDAVCL